LIKAEVPAGSACPVEVLALWRPGGGYSVCIAFEWKPIKQWSPERKAARRKSNLLSRLNKQVPLFKDEFYERELAAREDYFNGKNYYDIF